jgi:uncharacterized SAM-binding protein YcdF (DUF218 family)
VLFRWARRVVLAVVLVGLIVAGATATTIWWVARGDDRTTTDAILVLGAAQYAGRPSSVLEARLEHAKTLYEQGVAPRVVTLGGGQAGDRTTEAEAGARYLQQRGVDDVVALPEGTDTLESLQAAAVLLAERGWSSATVVTDPWHGVRSREIAEDLGIDAHLSPTRAGPSVRTRATQLRYIARETAAYLYYELFGDSSEARVPAV